MIPRTIRQARQLLEQYRDEQAGGAIGARCDNVADGAPAHSDELRLVAAFGGYITIAAMFELGGVFAEPAAITKSVARTLGVASADVQRGVQAFTRFVSLSEWISAAQENPTTRERGAVLAVVNSSAAKTLTLERKDSRA